jgi:hypothetical protein
VTGFRSERVSISAAEPGSYRLPEAVIHWWNVDSGEWARAASPEWQLEVAALDSASRRPAPDWRRQPPPEGSPGAVESPAKGDALTQPRGLLAHWPWLLGTLTALLAGLLLWSGWRTRRQRRGARRTPPPSAHYGPPEPAPEELHPAERTAKDDAIDKVASAYRAANAARARQALLDWASAVWANDPPGNLWQLSLRLPEPLADDVRKLDKAFFSPTPIEWHTAPVAERLGELPASGDVAEAG